ncbi:hypothetical protein [Moorena sp. SIO4G3]|uniref:hypothetical protein n=1 Tax=Moorena sp. SIO4G3 TaxID=2607821 RepID=UPI001429B066|nr:hypothetical protein [Moorena sp. SIO4G3]NEO78145.1 hypothetical protein [Moorena sp. SIO4G3]
MRFDLCLTPKKCDALKEPLRDWPTATLKAIDRRSRYAIGRRPRYANAFVRENESN